MNYYNSKFNFFQVNNVNVNNVTINNYYDFGSGSKAAHQSGTSAPKNPENEKCQKMDKSINWDMAEEDEENINDVKEKYLPSKLKTLKLERVYTYLKNYSKAEKLHHCGTYLEFLLERDKTIDKKKLRKMNSCKLRLCPYCAWRRALRTYSNVKKCYEYIERQDRKQRDNNYKSRFLLLTLTTRNVTGEELKEEVSNILAGFSRFRQYKAFENAFCGFVRALEVTCDREPYITQDMYLRKYEYYLKRGLRVGDKNPNYLYFNVHIHVLLHTSFKRYQENYLEQREIVKLWQKALRVDYEPVVDIRSFKAKNRETKGKELAEIAKYTVKPTDYLQAECDEKEDCATNRDFLIDVRIICYLDISLSGRRLLEYSGSFREAHRALKLDDEKMTDNIDVENSAEEYILKYYFSFRKKIYKRIK